MNKLFIVIGASGVGKTTIVNKITTGYNIHEAISFTTREPRKGEKNGVDYHFVKENDIDKLNPVEQIKYNENIYGLIEKSFDYNKNNIVIVEPNGAEQLKTKLKEKFEIITIFLELDENIRKQRMIARGDNIEDVLERIELDKEQFKNISADYLIKSSYCLFEAIMFHELFKKEELK